LRKSIFVVTFCRVSFVSSVVILEATSDDLHVMTSLMMAWINFSFSLS
jgi:hypothetical protein